MSRLRRLPRHWLVPTALAASLVAALLISPALGGPSLITKKKVVRTIAKKTQAIQARNLGVTQLGTTPIVIASLELTRGNWVVSSTFTASREPGVTLNCRLRIVGVGEDGYSASESMAAQPDGDSEESGAMEIAGRVEEPTQAQLLCSTALPPSVVRNVELTALKVPTLTVVQG